ncbi:MAG: cob(I)yrinic acid a,c-diamide adenosyltransferase, partial [Pseudomonadota bacterium]
MSSPTENEDHKAKMQKLQAEQNAKRDAASDPGRGLVLIHTGNGKGKSSSAFGVVIRALGWGRKVGVVQFIKGSWTTGERQFFKKLNDLSGLEDARIQPVDWHTMGEGFTWDTQDRERDIAAARSAFDVAKDMMTSGVYDLVVLDEINIALRYDYLGAQNVKDVLEDRHQRTSVILTG